MKKLRPSFSPFPFPFPFPRITTFSAIGRFLTLLYLPTYLNYRVGILARLRKRKRERESRPPTPPKKKEKEKENQDRILFVVSKENASLHPLSTNRGLPSCYNLIPTYLTPSSYYVVNVSVQQHVSEVGGKKRQRQKTKGRAGH